MKRFLSSSFGLLVLLSVGPALGQDAHIMLSGSFDSLTIGGYGDGVPLVFAPVPGMMPVSPENLVKLPRVANDLEILPAQQEELKASLAKVRDKFNKRIEAIQKKIESARDDEDRENYSSELAKIEADMTIEIRQTVEDALLPFQRDRLKQIVAQSKLNNDGINALQSDEFAKLLKLTKEQQRELEEKQAKMKEKLAEEIRDLRRKRQRELIESVLNDSQMKTLKDLLGQDLAHEKDDEKVKNEESRKKR